MPRRILRGVVVSDKCDKTITVRVERRVRDPLYGKIIRRSAKYAAHDEGNQWKIGDEVAIEECRPLSKSKSWRAIEGKTTGASNAKTVDDGYFGKTTVKKAVAAKPGKKKPAAAKKKK